MEKSENIDIILESRKHSFYKIEQCKPSAQVESFTGKLRKKLKHDIIQAKRSKTMDVNGNMREHELVIIRNINEALLEESCPSKDKIKILCLALKSNPNTDMNRLEIILKYLRYQSSKKSCPELDVLVEQNICPLLLNIIADDDITPSIKEEAIWILINISSNKIEHCSYLMGIKTADTLIWEFSKRLTNHFTPIDNDIIWLLANLAGDCDEHRNLLIEKNIINKVVSVILESKGAKIHLIRLTTWLIHNLCLGRKMPDYKLLKPLLPYLKNLLLITDKEITNNVLWCFAKLSEEEEYSKNIYDSPTFRRILEIGNNCDSLISIKHPVLQIIGNIVGGEEFKEYEEIAKLNIIPFICKQLASRQREILRLLCWILSNLVISDHMRMLLLNTPLILQYIEVLLRDSDYCVKKEVVWVLVNIFKGGSYSEVEVITKSMLKPFIQLLEYSDTDIVFLVLEGIVVILEMGESREEGNLFLEMFLAEEGERLLDGVMLNPNKEIFDKAQEIAKKYLDPPTRLDVLCPPEVAGYKFNYQ